LHTPLPWKPRPAPRQRYKKIHTVRCSLPHIVVSHQLPDPRTIPSLTDNATVASNNTQTPYSQSEAAADSPDASGKTRALLHVPSRSSSQKIQPSPTSTGLSGVTASDPNDSIGRQSKDSKTSIIGATQRNGSVAGASPGGASGNAEKSDESLPQSPPMQKPKKSRGLLGFLNCCGAPNDANGADEDIPLPTKKVTTGQQATTSSKPTAPLDSGVGRSTAEKEALRQTDPAQSSTTGANDVKQSLSGAGGGSLKQGKPQRQPSAREAREARNQQPLPAVPQDAEKATRDNDSSSNPAVIVQAPTPIPPTATQPTSSQPETGSSERAMAETSTASTEESKSVSKNDSQPIPTTTTLPPPPPIPAVDSGSRNQDSKDSTTPDATEEKQQWLLPPIEPRFVGKKCLVLDLDETLVHSSFKVICRSTSACPITADQTYRSYIKQILLSQ
jgi:RNA polymerase II subunit A small phosphatase-like protein